MSNKNDNRLSCIGAFLEKASRTSLLSITLAVGFSQMTFVSMKKSQSIAFFVKCLHEDRCWNLSCILFPAYIKMIVWFAFLFVILLMCIVLIN